MSWMQKLYETYELCIGREPPGSEPLMPIAHTVQQAHIEIVIDGAGSFRRATLVEKKETVIPATEKSAGRTSGEAAHPLCDKLQYCAADYPGFGGMKDSYFGSYQRQLSSWCESSHRHPKAAAVLAYVKKGYVVSDLVKAGILVAPHGVLVVNDKSAGAKKEKQAVEEIPGIFKLLTPKKDGEKSLQDQGDAFIRWRIESQGEVCTGTWEDPSLQKAWQQFDAGQRQAKGMCMVSGEESLLAEQHPARIRHGGDKAKIVSSNDMNGFTFRGRFESPDQAASIAFEVTQKAHNALRWLINRKQAFRSGDQVFAAWAVNGKAIPDPWLSTFDLFGERVRETDAEIQADVGDVGQSFARRFALALNGYRAVLEDTDEVVVVGLDSATPGRMAITFYREIRGSEFLDRIEAWHTQNAWAQNYGKDLKFIGAPSPRDITESAYGPRSDDKLRKATVERLLPCIIDGVRVPRDLVECCVRRARNRAGLEPWEWEKCLGIACSLYRASHRERNYQMTLEKDRKSRDYLYGCLLAVAEHIESRALYAAGEKMRDTTASRLMQRFADRPYSTWRNIELALTPYKSRLRSTRGAFLWEMEKLLDELISAFQSEGRESFASDHPLSGEFLLGYHCQRRNLRPARSEESEGAYTESNHAT